MNKKRIHLATLAGILICISAGSISFGQKISTARGNKVAPIMDILHLYTSPGVPALGPAEIEIEPLAPNTNPVPDSLPGSGLAQHPMLYIGEGCNKMFMINKGKTIWSYSTGKGWEYDDAWVMSNGNVLFSFPSPGSGVFHRIVAGQ